MAMLTEAARQRQLREWRVITTKELIDEGRAEARADGRAEGRVEEARELFRELGSARFGTPPSEILEALSAIDDINRLRHLIKRLLDVASWTELMASAE